MRQTLTHLLGLWIRKLQPVQIKDLLMVTPLARPEPLPFLRGSYTLANIVMVIIFYVCHVCLIFLSWMNSN